MHTSVRAPIAQRESKSPRSLGRRPSSTWPNTGSRPLTGIERADARGYRGRLRRGSKAGYTSLKKGVLAEAAEKKLKGLRWLPELLRAA